MLYFQTVAKGLWGGVLGRLGRGLGPFWGVFWVLTRLRADTAERGTSRERHRWADVCGKCRVSQCGGRGGRRWEPSCASMAVVVTAVKVTCIRRLRRHHRRCRRRRRPPRALRSTCLPYDFALPNLILLLNVFERMTFGKSTTFCHGYGTTKKSLKRSLTIQLIDSKRYKRRVHVSMQLVRCTRPFNATIVLYHIINTHSLDSTARRNARSD